VHQGTGPGEAAEPLTGPDAFVELGRVVDRLRSMPLTRLARSWADFPSLAAGARALAQEFADRGALVAGLERHVVPDVGDAAVGDQVAVTGRDLLDLDPSDADIAWMAQRLRDFRLSV
jgi:hypothetical protein